MNDPTNPANTALQTPPNEGVQNPTTNAPPAAPAPQGSSEPGYQAPAQDHEAADPATETIDVDAHEERAQQVLSAIKVQNDRAGSDAKAHPTHFQELEQIVHRLATYARQLEERVEQLL